MRLIHLHFLLCLLLILSPIAAAEDKAGQYSATLPNGITVELLAVSYHNGAMGLSQEKLFWSPDGSIIETELYRSATIGTAVSAGHFLREFTLRITAPEENEYGLTAFNSQERHIYKIATPVDANNNFITDLKAFIISFIDGQITDTIRIGVTTAKWQTLKSWDRIDWHKYKPDEIILGQADHPFILSWPEQRGEHVYLEMVHAFIDEDVRLVLYDNDGKEYSSRGGSGEQGKGLMKAPYWFKNIKLENLRKILVQKRPYQWVHFNNVSLEPGHQTKVSVVVMSAEPALFPQIPSEPKEQQNLGEILDRLIFNLSFPYSGSATYEIAEYNKLEDNPRVLKCDYLFSGTLFRIEVETVKLGNNPSPQNYKTSFDGQDTTLWFPEENKADIHEGRKSFIAYRLEKYCPSDILRKLLAHNVLVKIDSSDSGQSSLVLECVPSAEEKLMVWVTKEPDIYPVRIESYEFDNLRYRYQAEEIRYWNNFLFPNKISEAYYRTDDSGESLMISKIVVSLTSFSPNIEISPHKFKFDFPSGTSVSRYDTSESPAESLLPLLTGRRLPKTDGIEFYQNLEQAKQKIILLCFFDINQRPSRHCINELAKKYDTLKEKGVFVSAIHASEIDRQELDNWLQENNIPFPAGKIAGDIEKIKLNWDVKSLPWLILTDKEHVVTIKGFSVSELNEKIAQADSEKKW